MSMDPPMSMNQHPPQNFTMIEHLKEIGVSYNEREQREILLDWQENGHLPACVLDQSIGLTKTIFGKAVKPVKRRNFRYTLEEITALILYRVLIEEGIPRSLNVISRLTGVCQKKLWTMERVFCGTMSTVSASRASIWLPGLSPYLPLNYKETSAIGQWADWLQERYDYAPKTMLSCVLYAYLSMRMRVVTYEYNAVEKEKEVVKQQLLKLPMQQVISPREALDFVQPEALQLLSEFEEREKREAAIHPMAKDFVTPKRCCFRCIWGVACEKVTNTADTLNVNSEKDSKRKTETRTSSEILLIRNRCLTKQQICTLTDTNIHTMDKALKRLYFRNILDKQTKLIECSKYSPFALPLATSEVEIETEKKEEMEKNETEKKEEESQPFAFIGLD